MKSITDLLKRYYNTPPCVSVVGDYFYTEDTELGRIRS